MNNIPYIAQKSFNQTIQTEAVLLLLQDERPILINIPHIAKETFHRPIQLEAIRVLIDNNRKVDVSIPYISTDSFKDDFQLEALKLVAESEYTVVEQMPFIASSKYSEFDFRALKILVNGGRDFRPSIELFLGKIETDTQLLALSLVTNEKDEDGDAVYRVVSNIDNILLVDNQQKLEIFEKMVKSHEDLQHLEEKLKKNCDEKMRVFQDISDLD